MPKQHLLVSLQFHTRHGCCSTEDAGSSLKRGLWVSLPQCLAQNPPSLQSKRHRLKRKQRGVEQKSVHSPAQSHTGLQSELCLSEKTGCQTFRETISLVSLSLTLLLTDLLFHSRGSLSLFWIPTVFYITDSASVIVKHTVPGCV